MDKNREHEINKKMINLDMRMFKRKWITIFVMFFLLCISLDLSHVWYHEHAHGAIYDAYGVDYEYGWEMDGVILTFYVYTSDARKCNETCEALQMENEIYTYNLRSIFYSIWMIFFIYLLKCFYDDLSLHKQKDNGKYNRE